MFDVIIDGLTTVLAYLYMFPQVLAHTAVAPLGQAGEIILTNPFTTDTWNVELYAVDVIGQALVDVGNTLGISLQGLPTIVAILIAIGSTWLLFFVVRWFLSLLE